MGEKPRISTQVRAGLEKLAELQSQVLALPPHQFTGMAADEDWSIVHDYVGATELVVARLNDIPKAALAFLLADLILSNEAPVDLAILESLIDDFSEIEDDKATGCGRRGADSLAVTLPPEQRLATQACNVVQFPGPAHNRPH